MRAMISLIALVAICAGMTASAQHGLLTVTKEQYGERWPLTLERGFLVCEPGFRVVFETPKGERYALNGPAETAGLPRLPNRLVRVVSTPVAYTPVRRLSEASRRSIFAADVKCEDAAGRSDDTTVLGRCQAALLKRFSITDAERGQIGAEGFSKRWPPLKPVRMSLGPLVDAGLKLCNR